MIYVKNGDAWVETADADIPPAILAALKADGTHKNLKIHFPNGEIPDFDNSFIDRESLRFTESICSQDTFKFGLAEASVLEFEAVGVGNMRGMTIEANLFYGPDADPVAYVPLGVFTVVSCPRDAGVLMRRKVRAYTNGGVGVVRNSPVELAKLAARRRGERSYSVNMALLIAAAIGWDSPAYRSQWTKTPYSFPLVPGGKRTISSGTYAPGMRWQISGRRREITFGGDGAPQNALYCLERANVSAAVADVMAWTRSTLEELGADEVNINTVLYSLERVASGTAGPVILSGGMPVYYPQAADPETLTITWDLTISIEVEIIGGTLGWVSYGAPLEEAALFSYDVSPSGLDLIVRPTATFIWSDLTYSTYIDAYDIGAIAEGYFEAMGQFLRMARSGGVEPITLSADDPLTVLPGEYSSCWWTEDGPQRIGTVRVRYMAGDEEQIVDISIGDGAGLYDMTDNGYFSAVEGIDYATIEAFIQTHFAPAVEGLALTEIDLDMRALPHVQAGQALSVVAEDGEIVNTYMLRREMSGIQQLSDAITCPPPGVQEA